MSDTIINPPAPKPTLIKDLKIRCISSSQKNPTNIELQIKRTPIVDEYLCQSDFNSLLEIKHSICQSVVLQQGVSIDQTGEVCTIDNIKSWGMLKNTSNAVNNPLLRFSRDDNALSTMTTYFNTSTQQDIINITTRDSMPRIIYPSTNMDNNYVYRIIKGALAHRYRSNHLYIVHSTTFRLTDAVLACKMLEHLEGVDKKTMSPYALEQAKKVKATVERLLSLQKDITPIDQIDLQDLLYEHNKNIGIVHMVYSYDIKDIPGYNHEIGSVYLSNLDICVNCGVHQPAAVHPTSLSYDRSLSYNKDHITNLNPSMYSGYTYFRADKSKPNKVYCISAGEIHEVYARDWPVFTDADCQGNKDKNIIRIHTYYRDKEAVDNKYTVDQDGQQVLISNYKDIDLQTALDAFVIYDTYDKANTHLQKYGNSVNLDLVQTETSLGVARNKLHQLQAELEILEKKKLSLEHEAEIAKDLAQYKIDQVKTEGLSNEIMQNKKIEHMLAQHETTLKETEMKMQASISNYKEERSLGLLKFAIAAAGATASVYAFAKTYNKKP